MPNIADDPGQWDNMREERNIPKNGERPARDRVLTFTAVSEEDYRVLRRALRRIIDEPGSTIMRRIAMRALENTSRIDGDES